MAQLAVNLGDSRHLAPPQMVELAQVAERAGLEALFFGEVWGWDINLLLGVLAGQTSRIKLGANISNIYARTPSALAQAAATLDILSSGRAIIGLGIATRAIVQDWHGVPFDRPARRLRETVEIIRQALSGQRLDYTGEIFRVQRFRLTIAPVQDRIPIMLATNKPSNVELAGEIADGWTPANATTTTLPVLARSLQVGAERAGRDVSTITVAPTVRALVTTDPEPARRLVRRDLAHYLGSAGSLHYQAVKRSGAFLDDLERIREAWAKDPHTAERAVPEALVDAIAIIGSPAECRRRLAEWRAAGATMPILRLIVGATWPETCGTLEALGPAGSLGRG